MCNVNEKRVKDTILGSFYEILWQHDMNSIKPVCELDKFRELISQHYDNMSEELKALINSMSLDYFLKCHKVTVEITTKKKGKIIAADYLHQDMINQLIEIEERLHQQIYYKQKVHGFIDESGKMVWFTNMKPKTVCCDSMLDRFKFCTQHGLDCPDNNSITYTIDNGFSLKMENATYHLIFCPWCGTKLKEEKEETQEN